ncbi:acyltransferase [Massilia sp. G4R7]|uniref:Acyltransferase n=1 Tax=Massilia phyllostachyos TaxID=2898585 RepID=A0ABS8Q3H2_9BURK|nr:acyltransferase [Massilia phyllostachyos]MCD2516295.1 acyltransferase [Massilia phyllostachyos]
MSTPALPRVTLQGHGQFDETCWHSILISLLRGLAAFIVATAHLRAAMYPAVRDVADPPLWFQGLAFVSGFAHQAVLVFFFISGWLVGGSLLNRIGTPHAVASYAIDRATRLWTVLIPTFLLTFVFALGIGLANPEDFNLSPDNPYSALTFAGNLFGLQGIALPDYGGNFPLWSLANETWYYVLFPLLALAGAARDLTVRLACAAALVLLAVLLPAGIVAYFVVWLLGVAFSRIRIECGSGVRWAWLVLVLAGAAYFRLTGELDEFELSTLGQDLVCALLYLVLLSSLQFNAPPASTLARRLGAGGKFFAEFSFSLYVLHVPLIGVLHYWCNTHLGLDRLSPFDPLHTALYFGMLATLIVAAYLSYLLFESRTYRIRTAIKQHLIGRRLPRAERRPLSTGQ